VRRSRRRNRSSRSSSRRRSRRREEAITSVTASLAAPDPDYLKYLLPSRPLFSLLLYY